MSEFPYVPFPFSVTPASPLLGLSPVASNTNQGWLPSCSTPECVPTANWSTSLIGASLSFQFWGWDVAFDGEVKGNMSIELLRDGVKEKWNPSADTLFGLILDASPNAELTVDQARVNGSTLRWTIPSHDKSLSYKGFIEQPSAAEAGSRAMYISSKAGDTASMQFNASTFLLHGPCGPTNGLIKVTIDGRESTAKGFSRSMMHQLVIENVDGATLGIDKFEFFWLPEALYGHLTVGAMAVVIIFVSVFAAVSLWAGVLVFLRRPKLGKKLVRLLKALFS
ncbi:hypothetical protein B0J17DRAFT_719011 [Rhizoctonia solani]|nr:hypothetical protein B0J17DRAFT_719011 [Rhizoctonia solani]